MSDDHFPLGKGIISNLVIGCKRYGLETIPMGMRLGWDHMTKPGMERGSHTTISVYSIGMSILSVSMGVRPVISVPGGQSSWLPSPAAGPWLAAERPVRPPLHSGDWGEMEGRDQPVSFEGADRSLPVQLLLLWSCTELFLQ